jgi:hypothetical protein
MAHGEKANLIDTGCPLVGGPGGEAAIGEHEDRTARCSALTSGVPPSSAPLKARPLISGALSLSRFVTALFVAF